MTTPPRRTTPAARATRRSRRPAPRTATFLDRNRTRLLWLGGLVGFLLLAGIAFVQATTPAYACTELFNPTPAPSIVAPTAAPAASGASPAPVATAPAPGYVQPDMGHLHVDVGTRVKYANCPPASGKHYNAAGAGPIDGGLYGPNDPLIPQNWVHNLEHGAIVLLYRCEPANDACTDSGQAALKALIPKFPATPICHFPPGKLTPVIARFDQMEWPFAALVWDVVLPMQTIDEAQLFSFFTQQAERFNPEKLCTEPTPAPGPTATPGPTGSAAPSTSPSGGASVAPSGSATPAASSAPS